jgi:hypothetical protein
MGRARTKDHDLPRRVYLRHGAYFHVDGDGKWHNLGRDRTKAIHKARGRTTRDRISSPSGAGFLYVVGDDRGRVKIGIASDVTKRINTLQIGQPIKLKLLACFAVPPAQAKTIERRAHRAFAEHRMSGEWFAVSFAEHAHWEQLLKVVFWKSPVLLDRTS